MFYLFGILVFIERVMERLWLWVVSVFVRYVLGEISIAEVKESFVFFMFSVCFVWFFIIGIRLGMLRSRA